MRCGCGGARGEEVEEEGGDGDADEEEGGSSEHEGDWVWGFWWRVGTAWGGGIGGGWWLLLFFLFSGLVSVNKFRGHVFSLFLCLCCTHTHTM